MTKQTQIRYQDALDYIYSFVDYSRTHQANLSPENFDLSRMVNFMDLLGAPHEDFPSIHIAGSKGKGSVSAFCASVLQTAGYKVGLYTSPHLKDFEERMQINQVPISRTTLADYVEEIKPAIKSIPELTTFEIMTGLAFLFFARQEVDIAVIEVGLGGRLDATNIITPLVSVITSLYLDHISILGETLEEIAAEKGGIIKKGIPVVCAPQEEGALNVIVDIASRMDAPLTRIDKDYPYSIISSTLDGQKFSLVNPGDGQAGDSQYIIPLLGEFQVLNAVTAYAALNSIRSDGFPLEERAIQQGLESTVWPARFEVVRREPPVIFDSAHNPASMRKLRETIDFYFPDLPLIVVFGISEDKQLDGMLQEILPRASHLIATKADHPRAMDSTALEVRARDFPCSSEAVANVQDALSRAVQLAGKEKIVLVTGSIFVAASARIAWFNDQ
ncbi:MAG: bifunctional folylpolyglutamate synthase/dihydrofolate synthase [Anaerolineales bacterium]|nr:bifunctional folylpolyglutamate synthase/dihydrofolate synthase [Anaerolineales bacterium]